MRVVAVLALALSLTGCDPAYYTYAKPLLYRECILRVFEAGRCGSDDLAMIHRMCLLASGMEE